MRKEIILDGEEIQEAIITYISEKYDVEVFEDTLSLSIDYTLEEDEETIETMFLSEVRLEINDEN
ncbi:hypothetical protein D3C81_1169370 [compost metagenome]